MSKIKRVIVEMEDGFTLEMDGNRGDIEVIDSALTHKPADNFLGRESESMTITIRQVYNADQ